MELEEAPDGEVSVEDRARAMGWKPRDEYRGDPRRWTDAAEFIEHGEAELPILRDQGRRLSEKVVKLTNDLETLRNSFFEQQRALKDAIELARRADDRGYQRGLAELKAQRREAIDMGDSDAADQINEQILTAERERGVVTAAAPATPTAPVVPPKQEDGQWPETKTFLAENPWFHERAVLRNAMIAEHADACQRYPSMSRAEQYDIAKAAVIEAFPHYFPAEQPINQAPTPTPDPTQPRRILKAPVQPPSRPLSRDAKGSPFDEIADPAERAEAKDAVERMRRLGSDITDVEYIDLYFGRATPLEQQAKRKRA